MNKFIALLFFGFYFLNFTSLSAQGTSWNGSVDNNWNNADNWSNGIPNDTLRVGIPNNSTLDPVIHGGTNATATRVNIGFNSKLIVEDGATLTIKNSPSNGLHMPGGDLENAGVITIDSTATEGIVCSGEIINTGRIEIGVNGGGIGGANAIDLQASTFENSGIFRSTATRAIVIRSNFINTSCGQVFLNGQTLLVANASFNNHGYIRVNGIQHSSITNNGIYEDVQNNINANTINNGLVLRRISNDGCTNELLNAIQVDSVNNFSVAETWYTNDSLTNVAGVYDSLTNTFISNNSLIDGNQFLYFNITDTVNNCTQTVSIRANYSPNLFPEISCPQNIMVNNDVDECGAIVNFTPPVGTDHCSTPTTLQTSDLGHNDFFPIGTTTISYEATDSVGQSVNCSFTVTVVDDELTSSCSRLNVTSPNGGESFELGSVQTITWSSANASTPENIKIEITDDENTYIELVASTPNDGEHELTIPANIPLSTAYKIRISDVLNSEINDISDGVFSIIEAVVNVTTLETLDHNIYPNPSTGKFIVNLPANISNAALEIFDISGRIIDSRSLFSFNPTIDLTGHKAGVYLVRITSNQHQYLGKVILK